MMRYLWTREREGREPRGGLHTADALTEILRSEDLPGVMPPDWLVATLRMDQDDEGVSTLVAAWMDGPPRALQTSCPSALGSETATLRRRPCPTTTPQRIRIRAARDLLRPIARTGSCSHKSSTVCPHVTHSVTCGRYIGFCPCGLSVDHIPLADCDNPACFCCREFPAAYPRQHPSLAQAADLEGRGGGQKLSPPLCVERNPTPDAIVSTIKAAFPPESISERDSASY